MRRRRFGIARQPNPPGRSQSQPNRPTTPPDTTPTGHRSAGRQHDARARAPAGGGGELEGMRGTTPKGADVTAWIPGVNDFWVAKGNTELSDFNYAAESYDAVIVIALAAQPAGTDGSAHAAEINGITGGRREVHRRSPTAWRMIEAGATSTTTASPVRSTSTATASRSPASYAMLEFGADNRLDEPLEELRRRRGSRVRRRRPGPGRCRARRRRRAEDRLAAPGDRQPCVPRTTRVRRCRVRHRRDQRRGRRARHIQSSTSQGDSGDTSTDTATSPRPACSARTSTPSSVPPRRA